jgi:tetratricopeptide (TPR) repeat protein
MIGLFLVAIMNTAAAQQAYPDSLRWLNQIRDKVTNELGVHDRARLNQQRESIDSYLRSMLVSCADSAVQIEISGLRARIMELTGNLDSALSIYASIDSSFYLTESTATRKQVLMSIGNIYQLRGRYDLSLDSYRKALNFFEKQNDTVAIAVIHLQLASLYHQLQDTTKTLEFLGKAEVAFARSENTFWPEFLLRKALVLTKYQQYDSAALSLNEASSYCKNAQCTDYLWALHSYALGNFNHAVGEIDKAKAIYSEALARSRNLFDKHLECQILLALGMINVVENDFDEGAIYLEKALSIATHQEFSELLLSIYEQYISIYRAAKDYDRLAKFQGLYIEQKDKIYGEELLIRISTMQAEFETREDVNLIEEQKELMALQEKTLRQKIYINIIIGCVVIMLLFILWILYKINKRKRAFNRDLDFLVQERTKELEKKQFSMEKASLELAIEMGTIQRQIKERLSTLEGMYYVIQKEPENSLNQEKVIELEKSIEELRAKLNQLRRLQPDHAKS